MYIDEQGQTSSLERRNIDKQDFFKIIVVNDLWYILLPQILLEMRVKYYIFDIQGI